MAIDHHESYGRVERLNINIRENVRNMDKNKILGRSIAVYNTTIHAAVKYNHWSLV